MNKERAECVCAKHRVTFCTLILTFMLPVPGAAVLLTTSVIHAVQDDQNKGDQL